MSVDLEKIATMLEKAAEENDRLKAENKELREENVALKEGSSRVTETLIPKEASFDTNGMGEDLLLEMGDVVDYSTGRDLEGKDKFNNWLKNVSS